MTIRVRQRDHAGLSPASWKKHRLLWRAASGQAHAFRHTHPSARCLIIDMHAGDGAGMPLPQLELFTTPPTYPTPLLANHLAHALGNTDVVLCEQKRQAREALAHQFPDAVLLEDHIQILSVVRPEHRWALVLNDPCGYSSHGIDTMEALARRIAVDWLIVFNEGALRQLMGMQQGPVMTDPPHVARVRATREHYAWMGDPLSWAQRLDARHMARTLLIKASPRFHYRLLVLSHTLSQTLRPPLWEHLL